MSVILEARGLHKRYGTGGEVAQHVLRGLDVDIHSGEILCVLGRSGVGKSTLLNILGLLDGPDEGHIHYRGRNAKYRDRDLAALGQRDRARMRRTQFGFVFQLFHLLPDLRVLENVCLPAMVLYGLRDYRAKRIEIRDSALDLLGRIGIADKARSFPNELSGGERQRVAIARALVNQPEVVFCDEPTGNLDTLTSESIHQLIYDLNRERGTAFVIVTHDPALSAIAEQNGHPGRRLTMRDGVFVNDSGPAGLEDAP